MASSASPKRPPASPKKAHLITTPGFATSLLINLLVMSAALAAIGSYRPTRQLAMGAYDWVTFQVEWCPANHHWFGRIGCARGTRRPELTGPQNDSASMSHCFVPQMMNAAHRAAWWWAIGLLSSSVRHLPRQHLVFRCVALRSPPVATAVLRDPDHLEPLQRRLRRVQHLPRARCALLCSTLSCQFSCLSQHALLPVPDCAGRAARLCSSLHADCLGLSVQSGRPSWRSPC